MNGALLGQMKNELNFNMSKGGFETDISITDKSGKKELLKGQATLHSLTFDPEQGVPVTGTNAHISVAISDLIDAGFDLYSDTKNPNKIFMKNWVVEFATNDSIERKFRCDEVRPSSTTGIIVITLVNAK